MSEEALAVNRWKRYGKDRLYVTATTGSGEPAKVGWWDLATDEPHPENPEQAPLLAQAVADWRAGTPTVDVPPDPTPEVAPESTIERAAPEETLHPGPLGLDATAMPWRDLAENRPGEAARDRALSKRAEAPMKTVLARVLGVHTDERAWRIGADGEELVAAQLDMAAKKDPRWRFLHAIPVGNRGSDIDHLVIGPGGVFTANAKHHPGAKIWVGGSTLMVNGSKTDHIRNARYEAQRAAKLLTSACGFPVHVHGLVVAVNAKDVVIKTQPDSVSVTWRRNVAKWLLNHGDILGPDVIDAIYETARRSTTWTA